MRIFGKGEGVSGRGLSGESRQSVPISMFELQQLLG